MLLELTHTHKNFNARFAYGAIFKFEADYPRLIAKFLVLSISRICCEVSVIRFSWHLGMPAHLGGNYILLNAHFILVQGFYMPI